MRIKMLETIGNHARGTTIPVPDKVGERYIAAGFAERAAEPSERDDLAEAIAAGVARGLASAEAVRSRITPTPVMDVIDDLTARVAELERVVRSRRADAERAERFGAEPAAMPEYIQAATGPAGKQ